MTELKPSDVHQLSVDSDIAYEIFNIAHSTQNSAYIVYSNMKSYSYSSSEINTAHDVWITAKRASDLAYTDFVTKSDAWAYEYYGVSL